MLTKITAMIQSTMCSTQKLQSVVCKTTMLTTLNYKRTMNRTTYTTLHYTTFLFLTSTVATYVVYKSFSSQKPAKVGVILNPSNPYWLWPDYCDTCSNLSCILK